MSKYNFSIAVLYSVCRLAWTNCGNNLAGFAARKAFYIAAYVASRMAEIDAAEQMPDEQARDEVHETLRIQLKEKAATCREYWNYLERYIVSAFPKSEWKPKTEAAGKEAYDEAGEENWDKISLMMSNAYEFITNNSGVLAINLETGTADNMPAGFPAEFEGVKNDFNTTHSDFLQAEEGAQTGTQTKGEANEIIYDKMRLMLDDGVVYFKNNAAVKKQFVLVNLLELIGTPTGGGGVKEFTIGGGQIVNVAENLEPGSLNGKKIKNTSTLATLTLFVYLASSSGQGWTGVGFTINPGQEITFDESQMGMFQPFLNVQNQSGSEGSFEVTGF